MSRTPTMHDSQKPDGPVVPTKLPNNVACATAEGVEGRGPAKRNMVEQNAARTQRRTTAPSALDRVRQAAERHRKAKFTALLHHITSTASAMRTWRSSARPLLGSTV